MGGRYAEVTVQIPSNDWKILISISNLKCIKYIYNVYKIDTELRSLTDGRINPTYQTSHVVSLLCLVFYLESKVLVNSII